MYMAGLLETDLKLTCVFRLALMLTCWYSVSLKVTTKCATEIQFSCFALLLE